MVLTRMIRFIAVRIFVEGGGPFRLRTGERRYLYARHHYQYPQHTGDRLSTFFHFQIIIG